MDPFPHVGLVHWSCDDPENTQAAKGFLMLSFINLTA